MGKGRFSVDQLVYDNAQQRAIGGQSEAGLEHESQVRIVMCSVDIN